MVVVAVVMALLVVGELAGVLVMFVLVVVRMVMVLMEVVVIVSAGKVVHEKHALSYLLLLRLKSTT